MLCRQCGHRFSLKPDVDVYSKSPIIQYGKKPYAVVKPMTTIEKTVENRLQRGQPSADTRGKLVEFAWNLQKENRSECTIKTYISNLGKLLLLGADLTNPDNVKEILAKNKTICNNSKSAIVTAYSSFLNWQEISWKKPAYHYQPKIPFIPLEKEIDQLVAGCGKKTAALLQLLKETGMRLGEAHPLKWTDINFKSETVSVNNPEKNGNPRILSISTKCLSMLERLPKHSDKVFGNSTKTCRFQIFKEQRERLARKLQNPRLNRITFHTLRHWKATMEYHETKDILHVKEILGHKSIQSTMIYISLERTLFKVDEDQFTSKVAKTIEEAQKLVDVGFEFVCDFGNDGKLFRKRT